MTRAPVSPLGTPGRAPGSKTPLHSPLGKTTANDDAVEKQRALSMRQANDDYRRRCALCRPVLFVAVASARGRLGALVA